MKVATDESWWLQSSNCDTCSVQIRKHHMSRHRQTKGHIARAGAAYKMLPSDEAFTTFLHSIRKSDFSRSEVPIYDRNRPPQTRKATP